MGKKVKWGILSTATIAVEQMLPALVESSYCEVHAIASRTAKKARRIADQFQIPNSYSRYQDLLDDKEIEIIYIPLPNHLHVKWAIKALQAGKHVLLEKPIAMSSVEAAQLLEEAKKHPQLKIMEAFMYKFHPQWIRVKNMLEHGAIGELKMIQSSFSFFDDDPKSIVNKKEFGGGSLMDIGCYPISISRYLFNSEPIKVAASITYDPNSEVDIVASGILEFEKGTSTFFSAIQMADSQQVSLCGTAGSILFEMPFNPPKDKETRIWFTKDDVTQEIVFEACNQYAIQADVFALSVRDNRAVPVPLEDGIKNMQVIEKLRESHALGKHIDVPKVIRS